VAVTHWSERLLGIDACSDAREWCATQPDLAVAWANCTRGDWMLWLLGRLDESAPWSEGRRPLVRCALACAAEALPYVRGEVAREATEECLSVTQAWCEGAASEGDVREARAAAYAAAYDAAYAAAYAARAAAHAADYAAAHAEAAAHAAHAAAHAADAAYAARTADAAADAAARADEWRAIVAEVIRLDGAP
jgi:hypothetical protein